MKVVVGSLALFFLLFVAVLASTLVGGVVGWIVEAVFPFVIDTLNRLGDLNLTGFEMGAVLGFVGSFFRSSSSK